MQAGELLRDARVRTGALIGACFLLGSTGWLSWLYHIAPLVEPAQVDFYTMVVGYLAQALGVGLYMLVCWRAGQRSLAGAAVAAIVVYVVLLEPAAMSGSLAVALGFGWAMNVACGFFQGHYLTCLAQLVAPNGRGFAFGAGYAASTLVTWALSSVGGGVLATGAPSLVACVLMALAAVACVMGVRSLEAPAGSAVPVGADALRPLVVAAGTAVLVASLVRNAGFSFPTGDLSGVVNLELSRLFYGVGLVVAGIAADRDRRYALVCCAASLAAPFIMLALSGAGASAVVMWAIGYLLFGFFAVWRVVLFADLAADTGRPWLAGAGLALGRVGDVLATALCLALADHAVALIAVAGVLFIGAGFLLFFLFTHLYGHADQAEAAEEEEAFDPLVQFADEHDLSKREQDVLYFLLGGLTNTQIARELGVSEATVKFHVRNILKKTGCPNRNAVAKLYNRSLK